jgi:hypothetical protein
MKEITGLFDGNPAVFTEEAKRKEGRKRIKRWKRERKRYGERGGMETWRIENGIIEREGKITSLMRERMETALENGEVKVGWLSGA